MKTYSILYWQRITDFEMSDHVTVQADSIEDAFQNAELQLLMAGIEYTSLGCAYEVVSKSPSLFDQLAAITKP